MLGRSVHGLSLRLCESGCSGVSGSSRSSPDCVLASILYGSKPRSLGAAETAKVRTTPLAPSPRPSGTEQFVLPDQAEGLAMDGAEAVEGDEMGGGGIDLGRLLDLGLTTEVFFLISIRG